MRQDVEHPLYAWNDAGSVHGHEYLLPTVLPLLDASLAGRAATIVDAGCGNGYVDSVLAKRGYRVTAFDVSPSGIDVARHAFPEVRFEVGSIYDDWPTVAGGADCVLSLEVIEHLFDPKSFFRRSYDALGPGGLLVVSTPYHGYLKNLVTSAVNGWDRHFSVDWDGGHVKFFSKRSLARMASAAGFRELRLSGVGRLPGLWKSMILTGRK